MAAFKSVNVMHPSRESARKWSRRIKEEKEEQKSKEQQAANNRAAAPR